VDAVLATHSETCAFAMRDVELFAGGDGGGCDLELISTPFSASTRFTFDHHQGDVNVLEGWLRNKTAENLAIWIASTESYAVVAEDEGRIVGLAMLSAEGTVSLCYLIPEAHHRNIGKANAGSVGGRGVSPWLKRGISEQHSNCALVLSAQ
jgi:hypothetical protein